MQPQIKAAADDAASVTERLRLCYSPESRFDTGQLNRVSRRINKLAAVAGVEGTHGRKFPDYHTIYTLACERGFEQSAEAKDLRRELSDIEQFHAEKRTKKGRGLPTFTTKNARAISHALATQTGFKRGQTLTALWQFVVRSGVLTTNAAAAEALYKAACRAMHRVLDDEDDHEQHREINKTRLALLTAADYFRDDAPATADETPACATDEPAMVVDLAAWRTARAR
ncbi:MAG: hypothetical protein ACJ74Q_06225 [Pyrinomonadaceae bacterium]